MVDGTTEAIAVIVATIIAMFVFVVADVVIAISQPQFLLMTAVVTTF